MCIRDRLLLLPARSMKWLLVSPGQPAFVRCSLSAAATLSGYPMKLSALVGEASGLKPKAIESPRARYSAGLLEAATAAGLAATVPQRPQPETALPGSKRSVASAISLGRTAGVGLASGSALSRRPVCGPRVQAPRMSAG